MLLVHILRDGAPLVPPFPEPKIPALLRARSVLPSDYFWHEGMSAWAPVGERWTAEASPAPERPADSPPSVAAAAPLPALDPVPVTVARRHRPSLLLEAKRRYYETLAPWGEAAADGRPR